MAVFTSSRLSFIKLLELVSIVMKKLGKNTLKVKKGTSEHIFLVVKMARAANLVRLKYHLIKLKNNPRVYQEPQTRSPITILTDNNQAKCCTGFQETEPRDKVLPEYILLVSPACIFLL